MFTDKPKSAQVYFILNCIDMRNLFVFEDEF